jgi:hypothetical protein
MKSSIFGNITQCSPLKVNGRFKGTCFRLQGRGIGQSRNQHEESSNLVSCRIWGFHSGGFEEYLLLGYDLLARCFAELFYNPEDGGGTFLRNVEYHSTHYTLATCLLAALLNYSTTLKMEAVRSSETSGTTQRTTRRHIPEEDTLQSGFLFALFFDP